VTGAGGPSGMAAIAALKAKGFVVIAVDMREVVHAADAFIKVPAARDPGYLPVLHEIMSQRRVTWLMPTVSEELVLVARAAPQLRRDGIATYIGEAEAVRICDDKWDTACALKSAGIAVPAGAVGDANSLAVRELGFPLVSRPRVGRGGRDVVVHDRPGLAALAADPVWQAFMPGTEYDVLMVAHPDAPHEIVASQVFEKTVLKEGRVGNALELVPAEAADVAQLARDAARALHLCGPMDMDIRRDAQGRARLLEINARIGAHTLNAPAIFDALAGFFERGHLG
jgi:carbamoylphosphate synthase large subunit